MTGRKLGANWGVYPVIVPFFYSTDEVITNGIKAAKENFDLDKGDIIVLTGSFPNNGEARPTNLMKIEEIQ